jgi:hypothetical protein
VTELLDRASFDVVLLAYLDACRSQSLTDIAFTIDLLWQQLDRCDDEIARTAQVLTLYARDRVRSADSESAQFLPLADESITGKNVWMLPNLTSLTNIYGRINQSRRIGLDGVTLVHDVQLQYGKVLEDSKALLESLVYESAMPLVPFSDYRLRGRAELAFSAAADESCLQAADILAGCAMRYARGAFPRGGRADPALRAAFFEMLDATNPFLATGINLVMSEARIDRLGIPHF